MFIHENGKKYARVTDILRPFADFSHIDPAVLENKARIGTNAHEAIEDDIAGDFPVPGSCAFGYFKSYLEWKKHLRPHFVQSEKRYFDDARMITGQIDALVILNPKDIIPTLIDFKTSSVESKDTWPMQAHLYAYLLKSNNIEVQPRFLFVKLDKYGSIPKVFPYQWNENTHSRCMGAIDSFWSNETK